MSEEEKEEITEETSQEEEENEDSKNSPGENSENLFSGEESDDVSIPAVEEPGPEEEPEPEETYEPVYVDMTLADGTKLENLKVNGTNFISSVELNPDIFSEDNMSSVMIEVNGESTIYENMALTQCIQFKNEWWFCIHEMSKIEQIEHDIAEMKETEAKLADEIEQIAMNNPETVIQ